MDGVEFKGRLSDIRERAGVAQAEAEAKLSAIAHGERESLMDRVKWGAPYMKELGSCALEIVKLIPHIPEAAISEARRKREFYQ